MIEHSHHTDRDVARFAIPLLRGEAPPDVAASDAARMAEGLRRSGLTALALRRLNGREISPALRGALESERNRLRADLALLYDRLSRLSIVLDGAGVPFIVLKGAALAPLLYEAPEHRPMVDVDILIRRGDWPRARVALLEHRYKLPSEREEAYWLANYFNFSVGSPDPRPASFDVHWSLGQEIRFRVDEEGLWTRSATIVSEGRTLRRLGNEDLLLGLILHLAYHYFDARLLWLHDIHLLCGRLPIDWEAASRRAELWGMRTIFALGLGYVEKVFPGSIPPRALGANALGAFRRGVLAPLRSPEPGRLFRGDDVRAGQIVQGLVVMDSPMTMARFSADKLARRLRFLGRRPRLK